MPKVAKRPASYWKDRREACWYAATLLKQVHRALKEVDARQAARAVKRTFKSIQGAQRHAAGQHRAAQRDGR